MKASHLIFPLFFLFLFPSCQRTERMLGAREGAFSEGKLINSFLNPHTFEKDTFVQDSLSTPGILQAGRILNGEREGCWIRGRDSLNYRNGKLHGHTVTYGGTDGEVRIEADYKDGLKEGTEIFTDNQRREYTVTTYRRGRKEGYAYTYRTGADTLINLCRYKEDIPYPFMRLYNDKKSLRNDLGTPFYEEDGHEFAGGIEKNPWEPSNPYLKVGTWVKYLNAVPVEFFYYDKNGLLLYHQQIADYKLDGPYSVYTDGILMESGISHYVEGNTGNILPHTLSVLKGVAATIIYLFAALGGGGGGFGSGNDDPYEDLWENCVRDGEVIYYNPDGSVRSTEWYEEGEPVKK